MSARCLLPLLLALGASAGIDDTSTGIDLNNLPHPALTKVRAGALKPGELAAFDGIGATTTQFETVLRGKGKSGRAWTVHLCDTCFEEVWRGDLDGNGTQDYAIVGYGPYGNTRKDAAYSLALLLMDGDGMPAPFFTPLFHGDNGDAVKHLVKLDGQVRLLVPRYDEVPSNERVGPYCSGHWVTQAYGMTSTTVEEVRGTIGGMRFPFVQNWAYSHPECANHPIGFSGRAKVLEIRTNDKGAVETKLRARDENSLALPVEPVADCEAIFADAIVYDSKAAREVAFPNLREDAQGRVADKIRAADVPVELRGVHECTASLMWARSNP